jgi:hypothetical protein
LQNYEPDGCGSNREPWLEEASSRPPRREHFKESHDIDASSVSAPLSEKRPHEESRALLEESLFPGHLRKRHFDFEEDITAEGGPLSPRPLT